MRSVRDESSLRVERGLEPLEQCVEALAELRDLVVWPGERKPPMEARGADVVSGVGHRAQRAEGAAGHQPAEPDREHGHRAKGDRGVSQQLMAPAARL